jgi:hypothetical protein
LVKINISLIYPINPFPTACSFPGGKSSSTAQRVAQNTQQSSLVILVFMKLIILFFCVVFHLFTYFQVAD